VNNKTPPTAGEFWTGQVDRLFLMLDPHDFQQIQSSNKNPYFVRANGDAFKETEYKVTLPGQDDTR